MSFLSRPSRSYANVEHDLDGLSSVGTAPYGYRQPQRVDGGFKTYKPPLSETHLRRTAGYDPHPSSAFAPLPPVLQLHKHKKQLAEEGQRAELDRILQPEYKPSSASIRETDGDSVHSAGPSRLNGVRTAGGVGAERKGKRADNGLAVRATASLQNLRPASAASGRRSGLGGVYVDANGKIHDTEYDPFAGVSAMSRDKSKRRSAFGASSRRHSGSSSSESGSDGADDRRSIQQGGERQSMDGNKDEEEIRKRLDAERRRLDELSGHAAARRRSMASERSNFQANGNGRGTPSLRSYDDARESTYSVDRFAAINGARSRSSHGQDSNTPLSPTFSTTSSQAMPPPPISARTLPPTFESPGSDDKPSKSTEMTTKARERISAREVRKDGTLKVTGFDAPISPLPPQTPTFGDETLKVPGSARMSVRSGVSRGSSEASRKPKPAERPREELFPETPAQMKRREERERRARGSRGPSSLAIDTRLASASSMQARVLPEIEIVEDDDPRVVIPAEGGRTTRVQTTHDHVIRGPFSHALHAQGANGSPASALAGKPASIKSGGASSSLLDNEIGYMPSRWAKDKQLRVTEDEKEKYRPIEWGGKKGDLAGKTDGWEPTTKDQIKRNWKDVQTNARFALFRTKKKLLRKAEM